MDSSCRCSILHQLFVGCGLDISQRRDCCLGRREYQGVDGESARDDAKRGAQQGISEPPLLASHAVSPPPSTNTGHPVSASSTGKKTLPSTNPLYLLKTRAHGAKASDMLVWQPGLYYVPQTTVTSSLRSRSTPSGRVGCWDARGMP